MESAGPTLPKLEIERNKPESAPVRRPPQAFVLESQCHFFLSILLKRTVRDDLALWCSTGANLAADGTRVEILVRIRFRDFFYFSFYPDLSFKFRPKEIECRKRPFL